MIADSSSLLAELQASKARTKELAAAANASLDEGNFDAAREAGHEVFRIELAVIDALRAARSNAIEHLPRSVRRQAMREFEKSAAPLAQKIDLRRKRFDAMVDDNIKRWGGVIKDFESDLAEIFGLSQQ